jgi:hypothetical protein
MHMAVELNQIGVLRALLDMGGNPVIKNEVSFILCCYPLFSCSFPFRW